jgi:hypothetical protein
MNSQDRNTTLVFGIVPAQHACARRPLRPAFMVFMNVAPRDILCRG